MLRDDKIHTMRCKRKQKSNKKNMNITATRQKGMPQIASTNDLLPRKFLIAKQIKKSASTHMLLKCKTARVETRCDALYIIRM